jgi:Zn-dependent peptidase ImmA (M78 family)
MDIKEIVTNTVEKIGTNDPFLLARSLKINVLYEDLGSKLGYFSKDYRFKFIHINQSLPKDHQRFVCAHELGHAICHPNENTPFLSKYTLFSVSKIEREANRFAVELLMPDSIVMENEDFGIYTLARSLGIPPKLAELKQYSR